MLWLQTKCLSSFLSSIRGPSRGEMLIRWRSILVKILRAVHLNKVGLSDFFDEFSCSWFADIEIELVKHILVTHFIFSLRVFSVAFCSLPAVISILLNFVTMFKRALDDNIKAAEMEKKRAEKEAEKEKMKNSPGSAKKADNDSLIAKLTSRSMGANQDTWGRRSNRDRPERRGKERPRREILLPLACKFWNYSDGAVVFTSSEVPTTYDSERPTFVRWRSVGLKASSSGCLPSHLCCKHPVKCSTILPRQQTNICYTSPDTLHLYPTLPYPDCYLTFSPD